MTQRPRDVLTPKEISDRTGFSYAAILRAIRRGELVAFEPIARQYRIGVAEYERWLHQPIRQAAPSVSGAAAHGRRPRADRDPESPGSFTRLRAIEQG
jgi:excisionase family DNA binding protein